MTAPAAMPSEGIERDPHDHGREYIPLPGGWEMQTKGAGSTYRLLDKKTGERHAILTGKDWKPLQAFFTRFAHELFAASRDECRKLEARALAAEAALAAERERCARIAEAHDKLPCRSLLDGQRSEDYDCRQIDAATSIAAAIRAQWG